MRSALLRGREHLRLGGIELIAEDRVAIAISLGGAQKTYAHTDPNEDAAGFAWGPGGALVAVADGHGGFEAAEIALEHLIESPASQWTAEHPVSPEAWSRHAVAALLDANTAILREVKRPREGPSRTTVVFALVRPAQNRLFYCAIGDSHLFQVAPRLVEDLALEAASEDAKDFLGNGPETVESLAKKCAIGSRPLEGTRALVLATDGLSERYVGVDHPDAEVEEIVERAAAAAPPLRPSEIARGVVEVALAAQRHNASGDNMASAVLWLEPSPPSESTH